MPSSCSPRGSKPAARPRARASSPTSTRCRHTPAISATIRSRRPSIMAIRPTKSSCRRLARPRTAPSRWRPDTLKRRRRARPMFASILASGLAAGAIYALVGVTYNTMFSTSRVMSFTAGQLAMLGGVFGSWFMLRLGMPTIVGLFLTLLSCALIGVITELVAVRPVLKSLEQHLYVLSTLALALMIQQVTAIEWSTEPQPFPRLFNIGSGVWDEKYWLPVVACAATIIGLEYLYRRTLVGRAILAIAEDNFAARALGLPERNLRVASYALAGIIGGVAGFSGGEFL